MAAVVVSCRLWIGGVCRRPSLRQRELNACCWPFSLEGYIVCEGLQAADVYQRAGTLNRRILSCDRMRFVFVLFWVGAARVGLECGTGVNAIPNG